MTSIILYSNKGITRSNNGAINYAVSRGHEHWYENGVSTLQ